MTRTPAAQDANWPPVRATERSLLRWRSALEHLQHIQTANADQGDPIATLGRVVAATAGLLSAVNAGLFLYDPAVGEVRRVVGECHSAPNDPELDAFARTVLTTDPGDMVDGYATGDSTFVGYPLLRLGSVIGAVVIERPRGSEPIETLDIIVAKMLASSATIALNSANSARLIEESARIIEASEQWASSIAEIDPLTLLVNRATVQNLLEGWTEEHPAAAISIDIDRFRVINEAYGSTIGDEVLRGVADRLRSATRIDDVIARVGSDQFVVVFASSSDQQLFDVATRISASLALPVMVGDEALPLSASIGTAHNEPGDPAPAVLLNADLARSSAKSLGGGQVVHFDAAMRIESLASATLERELATAIANDEFEVYYQPLVVMGERTLAGAEALVRWRHPEHGLVMPGHFLPTAEASGQIAQIDRLVMDEAIAQVRRWQAQQRLPENFRVSVNVSAERFRERDFLDEIRRQVQSGGIDARLRIELTETSMMSEQQLAVEVIDALHDIDVNVSVDDFGTGWSSLAYLKRFPVDAIKVDRAFVSDIVDDSDGRAIADVIVSLGTTLGLGVLAEGIESDEQESILMAMGCRYGQGFLYDQPLPADQFADRWLNAAAIST